MAKSYKVFQTLFLISLFLVATAVVALILFKIIGYTGTTPATIVGLTAMTGGLMTIISNIGCYCTAPYTDDPGMNRFILLIERIICGAVILFAGFIILYGGFLK